ncbi:MAG: prepilin-type N-terminal cleavage/methylation domain-containing protein [Myxococcota bacterium]
MIKFHNRKGGFTLIELMIVVAIIGILAAIAIPNFIRFQLKAKSSEGKVNLAAIRTAEEGYMAEYGTYIAAALSPTAIPGASKDEWVVTSPATGADFDTLGWSPEGNVYFQYGVAINGTGTTYTASASADIDGKPTNQSWGYVKNTGTQASPISVIGLHSACVASGTWDPTAVPAVKNVLFDTVGPCDGTSGQSVF